ncbi:hypothetical protein B6U45_09250 [Ligilactobacillus salivarius]|nr:hypothetical protein B6U45_09250 [Ligilactobacillus salivarius]
MYGMSFSLRCNCIILKCKHKVMIMREFNNEEPELKTKKTTTFLKKEEVSSSVSKLIDQGIKENRELLEWLKDK